MADFKNLTKREIDTFLKDNQHGILSMAGDNPMRYRWAICTEEKRSYWDWQPLVA